MIREAVITTRNADGSPHVTPLGYRQRGERVLLAPFVPSRTLDNLRRERVAVLNFTDDVRVIAGALTGRRAWPCVPGTVVAVERLADSLAHWELEVVDEQADAQRPQFDCLVRHAANHAPFLGFNRAQAAVVELSILVSRLDWLPPAKVQAELEYLRIAVEKTAGPAEQEAWEWLTTAITAHPRYAAIPELPR